MHNIVFIGAGDIAQAIHQALKKNIKVEMWDLDRSKVKNQKKLSEIIPQADILFLTLPSTGLPGALKSIEKLLPTKTILVGISKGINQKTKLLTSQSIESQTKNKYVIMHGPMIADQLKKNQGGAATLASKSPQAANLVRNIFDTKKIFLEISNQPNAIALAGVLKNIYAIAAGVAIELGWNTNKIGWLINQAVKETQEILTLHRYPRSVVNNYAFLADLLGTAYSKKSSNRKFGKNLANNTKQQDKLPEGWHSLHILIKKNPAIKKFPIIAALSKKSTKQITTAFDNIAKEL